MREIDRRRILPRAILLLGLCAPPGVMQAIAGAGTMAESERALPVVSDAGSALAHAGRQVLVRGIAREAKLGPVVVTPDLHVYCLDATNWSPALGGQPVEVQGTLAQTQEFATSGAEGGAGTEGPVWVLRDCRLLSR